MQKSDVIHRFLKARAGIDEDADMLAKLMEAGREPDAVELPADGLDMQEKAAKDAGLCHYMLYVGQTPVLLYPREQRELFLGIREEMAYGKDRKVYSGLSYTEAKAAMDCMDTAGARYSTHMEDGRVSFVMPAGSARAMGAAIRSVGHELEDGAGEKFHKARNACWANTVGQLARAFAFQGVSYIGSDGGTSGIRIDKDGAAYMASGEPGEYVPRYGMRDAAFEKKVAGLALGRLGGDTAPVKALYGPLAERVSSGIGRHTVHRPGLSMKEALARLGLDRLPEANELFAIAAQAAEEKNDEKESAANALLRMSLCRSMHLTDADGNRIQKLSKDDRAAYERLHRQCLEDFCQELGISLQDGKDKGTGKDKGQEGALR